MILYPPLLTGLRLVMGSRLFEGRYLVTINCVDIALAHREWEALLGLARARLFTESGFTDPPADVSERDNLHQAICHLRKALDESLGEGTGKRLILHGAKSSYALNMPRDAIIVEPSLAELAPHHISQKLVTELLNAMRAQASLRQRPASDL